MSGICERKSGVLMPVSALPGRFGIGTFGQAAYDFVDFLADAGQTYWQVLPLNPTGFGDSPYQSVSTFAGNPYFVDPDMLIRDGYLTENDLTTLDFGDDEHDVDYEKIYHARAKMFERVQEYFLANPPEDFRTFCEENADWLDDYAIFMAVKNDHDGASFDMWEDEIRRKNPLAVEMWRVKCNKTVHLEKMKQYLFAKQWQALKKYANSHGIKIIGDLPIYTAADSADVWANPRLFMLDRDLRPVEVAGCPPDAFSKDGQLWGNPVYDWKYQRRTGYKWWIRRMKHTLSLYDAVRIDHFRGFDSYYCIPAGDKTAANGVWRRGPGAELFNKMTRALGEMSVIAEDLGMLTESVHTLRKALGYPGMKILQFAFDSREESDYLPYKYDKNCVVYTGTHDNNTILGWAHEADEDDVKFAKEFLLARNDDKLSENMMIAALSSPADTCILTMQDIIGLDEQARFNLPSTVGNNWRWRADSSQIGKKQAKWLKKYTTLYGRCERDAKEASR